jgi:two-component system response regulator YesN
MEYAKEQLQGCPEKTARVISEELGYSSQYYFSRAFKKIEGVSPIEYRKLLK